MSTCEYWILYSCGECGRNDTGDRVRPIETKCCVSRGIQPSELGLDEGLWVHVPEAGPVVYIRACDPRLPLTTWPQVIGHMGLCHQLLSRI
jgi:hypothetical protein